MGASNHDRVNSESPGGVSEAIHGDRGSAGRPRVGGDRNLREGREVIWMGRKKNYKGRCFEAALHCAWEYTESEPEVVHGWVRGKGEMEGTYFVHAWCEIEGLVFDWSVTYEPVPQLVYYAMGDIREERVRRYSVREASRLAADGYNYGPWVFPGGKVKEVI